jgi:hypothetical protein
LIGKISPSPPEDVERALEELRRLADDGGEEAIRRCLGELLPDAQLVGAARPAVAGPKRPGRDAG